MLNQFQFCEENGVPFCVVIGESEIEKGFVTLREMSSRKEEPINRAELCDEIKRRCAELETHSG